jgi:hypothetical protein
MKIVSLLINKDVAEAERNFEQATGDNIVDLCSKYLSVLAEYRTHLLKLPEIPEVNFIEQSPLGRTLAEQSRTVVQAAIDVTETAHDMVEALLESFTSISVSDAIETFNRLGYNGSHNWSLYGSLVHVGDASGWSLTQGQAVRRAAKLRREAYVKRRITFLKQTDADKATPPA